jgi:hypothetical protein
MDKPFRNNTRVISVCGLRGHILGRAMIGHSEFYVVQIGPGPRDQIARMHDELKQEA